MLVRFQLAVSSILQSLKSRKAYKRLRKQIDSDLELIHSLPSVDAPAAGTLIIKCDDIGDFLVWQQVIPILEKHAPKPIMFVGNVAVRSLYEQYFDVADTSLWIDKKQWGDALYRQSMYNKVRQLNPQMALTPLFTRNYSMDDMLLLASNAPQRFAWHRQHHVYFPQMDVLDAYIGTQITSNQPIKLEYFRNQEFIAKVFHVPVEEKIQPLFPDFKKYKTLIVVPVASAGSKTWKAEYFARTISAVINDFDKCIILGGANGVEAAATICSLMNSPKMINLVNQTQLYEAFAFIGEASVLLTLDTFASHIGVLTATNTVMISNGTNAQRFADYAPHISSKFVAIFPPHYKVNPSQLKLRYSSSEIQTIKVETVVRAIKQLMT